MLDNDIQNMCLATTRLVKSRPIIHGDRKSMIYSMYMTRVFLYIYIQVVETQFIRNRDEQLKILHSCHIDPTSGHMGEKKTICRITECFLWNGVVKDVQQMVQTTVYNLRNTINIYTSHPSNDYLCPVFRYPLVMSANVWIGRWSWRHLNFILYRLSRRGITWPSILLVLSLLSLAKATNTYLLSVIISVSMLKLYHYAPNVPLEWQEPFSR